MQTLPPISCCQSLKLVFINCCKYSGRSRRSELFYYYIPIIIISIGVHLFGSIKCQISLSKHNGINDKTGKLLDILGFSLLGFSIITFIPLISLIVRRLHDRGMSGRHIWMYILWHFLLSLAMTGVGCFFFIIVEIIVIILLSADSEKKTNKYGPSPKYIGDSRNLIPGNNYIPPNYQFPQHNNMAIPNNYNSNYIANYNSNYPIQQKSISTQGIPQNQAQNGGIPFPQQNPIPNGGIPFPQQNPIPNDGISFPQQNPIPNEGISFPQQNPIPNEGISFSQQNPIPNEGISFPQQNLISPETINNPQLYNAPPQNNPYSQENPVQQKTGVSPYLSSDDPYSKPNPMQP